MGNSFFIERPILLKICKNEEIKQIQDFAGFDNQILYFAYRNSMQILLEDQLITLFEGQALLSGADVEGRIIHMNAGYFHLLFTRSIPYKGNINGDLIQESNNCRVFELADDLEFCKILCDRIMRERIAENTSDELVDSLLEGILSIMWKTINKKDKIQRDFIAIAKEYIEKHFKENLSLSELAQYVNVSVYHLSHMFKEEIGISPIQYAILCRMEYAKTQLRETSCSIHKIALELGYDNPNYFNLLFKKIVGQSPGKYRKDWKKQK